MNKSWRFFFFFWCTLRGAEESSAGGRWGPVTSSALSVESVEGRFKRSGSAGAGGGAGGAGEELSAARDVRVDGGRSSAVIGEDAGRSVANRTHRGRR